jgi:hypothetical protein
MKFSNLFIDLHSDYCAVEIIDLFDTVLNTVQNTMLISDNVSAFHIQMKECPIQWQLILIRIAYSVILHVQRIPDALASYIM